MVWKKDLTYAPKEEYIYPNRKSLVQRHSIYFRKNDAILVLAIVKVT